MRFIALAFIFLPLFASAQIPNSTEDVQPTEAPAPPPVRKSNGRLNVNSGNTIRINYGKPSWNTNPKKIDSATVIMREGVSGRVVQIQLNETEPDSSVFSGLYSINWRNMDQLETEFYVPNQKTLIEKNGLSKITADIAAHRLLRSPFTLRRLASGEQSVEIFDTREQARAAVRAYKAEQLVTLQNQKPTKFPSDQALDTQRAAEEQKAREEAARAASERTRMSQLEEARMKDLAEKQKAMNAKSRKEAADKARLAGDEGLKFFQDGKYAEARAKFDEALQLDPSNHQFYFQYGVSLYKTEDFNRSLVVLGLASGQGVNQNEKNYFVGLNYVKLNEDEQALKAFEQVVASKDATMAPSAQFYKGAIYFGNEDFENAQSAFQNVLDTSNDPLLDERAENFIDQVVRARSVAEERKHKWSISATIGEMYDSNVLLSSTSQQDSGSVTNSAGWRSLVSGSIRYRPVYTDKQEFAAQIDAVTLYTLDKTFKSDQSLRNADPTVVTLTLPWTHKGEWLGKAHKLDIIPGFESTIMSIDNNVSKPIINSGLVTFANLLVMNDKWFNNVIFDVRSDNSNLSTSVGDDDSTALRFRLGTSNLLFMNDKKDRILIPEGFVTMNKAKGVNATYNRVDLGVAYLMPTWMATTTNFKLGYFYLNYPSKIPAVRSDNSVTGTVGVSKRLSEIWTAGLLGSYNVNSSTDVASTYNKFTALLTLSAAYGF